VFICHAEVPDASSRRQGGRRQNKRRPGLKSNRNLNLASTVLYDTPVVHVVARLKRNFGDGKRWDGDGFHSRLSLLNLWNL